MAADAYCSQNVTALVSLSINTPRGMSGSYILPLLRLPDSTGDLKVKIPLASQLL